MAHDRLDSYIDAWLMHPQAGAEGGDQYLEALLACMSFDICYEDVPTGMVFDGHEGVAEMAAASHTWSNDLTIRVTSRQTDGTNFALECETTGTNTGDTGAVAATGRTFSFRGVSIGRFGPDGLVVEHRDYWDLMTFLGQIGALPSADPLSS
ncbi:MAG TPA: ester cyclase [Acidimicrobiales bacterium]|nr:ester cyclase [Acidimicrobiales bacterium]